MSEKDFDAGAAAFIERIKTQSGRVGPVLASDETLQEIATWRKPEGTLVQLVRHILHGIERGPPIESHPKSCTCGHEKCGRIDLETMTYEENA